MARRLRAENQAIRRLYSLFSRFFFSLVCPRKIQTVREPCIYAWGIGSVENEFNISRRCLATFTPKLKSIIDTARSSKKKKNKERSRCEGARYFINLELKPKFNDIHKFRFIKFLKFNDASLHREIINSYSRVGS